MIFAYLLKKFPILIPVLILLGCARVAATYIPGLDMYEMQVNTFLAEPVDSAKSIHVAVNEANPNPIFDAEVVRKLEKGLTNKGYEIAGEGINFDYVLIHAYGIDHGKPINYSYSTYALNIFENRWDTVSNTYTEIIYTRGLVLHLYDVKKLESNPKSKPLWTAIVTSSGSSSDLRSIIDYLIVAALEYFGQDTKKQRTLNILEGDRRVKALHQ